MVSAKRCYLRLSEAFQRLKPIVFAYPPTVTLLLSNVEYNSDNAITGNICCRSWKMATDADLLEKCLVKLGSRQALSSLRCPSGTISSPTVKQNNKKRCECENLSFLGQCSCCNTPPWSLRHLWTTFSLTQRHTQSFVVTNFDQSYQTYY